MIEDNAFKPRLGKIRSLGSKRGGSYLNRVLRAVALAGGPHRRSKSKFSGTHVGRGAGVGRVLGGRDRYSAFRQRRVIIKSRFVRVRGKAARGPQDHLRYIQRDGVTREGAPGQLYDKDNDRTDGESFLNRGREDRHQFRFIVSAEDGERYEDLRPFVRRLMDRMEEDLATKLDWVAVDHFNTGHPHTHIVLAGRDDTGRDLVIAREYISRGMRERACEIVTFDFGPQTDLEIEQKLAREMEQERFTTIDRKLLVEAEEGPVRSNREGLTAFQQSLRAGRLQKLGRLGLAEEVAPGLWSLAPELQDRLRELGIKGDIIKTMHREMSARAIERPASDYTIYDPGRSPNARLVGEVMAVGYAEELTERRYLIVEATDGYAHYVDIGRTEDVPREGSVIGITATSAEPKEIDRRTLEIARANGGRYDLEIHLKTDPRATADYAEAHIRRLEAVRRTTGSIERSADGTWQIGSDHLDRVRDYEQRRARNLPVLVETLSRLSVEQQVSAEGATWLDKELTTDQPTALREQGFGRRAGEAQARRRTWLIAQQLAELDGEQVVYRANLLATLRRRDLVRAGAQLSEDLGLVFTDAKPGQKIEGIYKKSVELTSGRFAVIAGERSFALVPWRPVLERNLGKAVAGIAREDNISWTIGRGRSGPAR